MDSQIPQLAAQNANVILAKGLAEVKIYNAIIPTFFHSFQYFIVMAEKLTEAASFRSETMLVIIKCVISRWF